MLSRSLLCIVAAAVELVTAHTVITYPLWRGNNLYSNSSIPPWMDPTSVGVDFGSGVNGSAARPQFPWGMQYTFPCGGMPLSTNRTNWPVGGGAISIAPGLAPGFKNSFIYINIAKTEDNALAPGNFSRLAMPPLAITGRDDFNPWPGQFCLPQVPMPAGVQFNVGDRATIQVVQVAANGQAVYNCADVTLFENGSPNITTITPQNCYNSTDIAISGIFTTTSLS